MVYVLSVQWNGQNGDFSTYLSSPAKAFGITPGTAFWMAKAFCLYLLVGSYAVLWLAKASRTALIVAAKRGGDGRSQSVLTESIKMVCALCNGHIAFSAENLGQKIPCPHCKATITLMKPKNIKTSCPSCGGHIEFPLHGLGQTIPCPHCTVPVTLQLPT